jgi:hypothetical protein
MEEGMRFESNTTTELEVTDSDQVLLLNKDVKSRCGQGTLC